MTVGDECGGAETESVDWEESMHDRDWSECNAVN